MFTWDSLIKLAEFWASADCAATQHARDYELYCCTICTWYREFLGESSQMGPVANGKQPLQLDLAIAKMLRVQPARRWLKHFELIICWCSTESTYLPTPAILWRFC